MIEFELAGVGAGLGGVFENTCQLKSMKYYETMEIDEADWTKAVEEEHERMIKNNVWVPIKLQDLSKDTKLLTTTWACKFNSNVKKRSRINARGYEQISRLKNYLCT